MSFQNQTLQRQTVMLRNTHRGPCSSTSPTFFGALFVSCVALWTLRARNTKFAVVTFRDGPDMHVAIQPVMSMSSSEHKTGIVMYSGNGDADHACDVTGPPCMWRSSLSSPRSGAQDRGAHSKV